MLIIKKKWEFNEIYTEHQRIIGKFFIVLYQENKIDRDFSLGIVVSKKVGNAVVRNLAKRRIRAFFRENKKNLPLDRKALIITKKAINNASWTEINLDLQKIIKTIASNENLK
ncbi:MAG: ribonuclease P protein component [Candidatus Cloacimonetes bacterium]|nr:ribonuclease P protein component [Candidatus Cloacimonadota bacterium]